MTCPTFDRTIWLLAMAAIGLSCSTPPAEDPLPSTPELRESLDRLPSLVSKGPAPGLLTFSRPEVTAAEVGEFVLEFEVGAGGIHRAGSLLIDFPKAWFSLVGPVAKPVQTRESEGFHYLGLDCSRPEAELKMTLQALDFDNQLGRFPHVVRLMVTGHPLVEGDVIRLIFRGTTAPYVAGNGEFRVAVDPFALGEYALLEKGAPYRVRHGEVEFLRMTGPSEAVVGETIEISLVAFDRYFNVVESARGDVEIRGLGENFWMPFEESFEGRATIEWTPLEAGFVWPEAAGPIVANSDRANARGYLAQGNPIRVVEERVPVGTFWGDLQSHSGVSKDAVGANDFVYARDASRLDFAASTEHSDDDREKEVERNGILPREWNDIRRRVRDLYAPGSFVPLLAYECSLSEGHRCVFFRGEFGIPWTPLQVKQDVRRLWSRLRPGEAFTVPHHLGRTTRFEIVGVDGPQLDQVRFAKPRKKRIRGPVVDWNRAGMPQIEPALEIYSEHGTSEFYDPRDPLSYERVRYLPSTSGAGQHYARDAWAAGHRLGVVGGSDNHSGQPGRPHAGLTAVRASELTRESVFDAILHRNTYATTGERIYLEFSVNGTPMGHSFTGEGALDLDVLVAAPRDIRYVEVVKNVAGSREWTTLERWEPDGKFLQATLSDSTDAPHSTLYYLRVELVGMTAGRVARAWSSPIWVDRVR